VLGTLNMLGLAKRVKARAARRLPPALGQSTLCGE
jgi:hypothetical protein